METRTVTPEMLAEADALTSSIFALAANPGAAPSDREVLREAARLVNEVGEVWRPVLQPLSG